MNKIILILLLSVSSLFSAYEENEDFKIHIKDSNIVVTYIGRIKAIMHIKIYKIRSIYEHERKCSFFTDVSTEAHQVTKKTCRKLIENFRNY